MNRRIQAKLERARAAGGIQTVYPGGRVVNQAQLRRVSESVPPLFFAFDEKQDRELGRRTCGCCYAIWTELNIVIVDLCSWHRALHDRIKNATGRSLWAPVFIDPYMGPRCGEDCYDDLRYLKLMLTEIEGYPFCYWQPCCERHSGDGKRRLEVNLRGLLPSRKVALAQ